MDPHGDCHEATDRVFATGPFVFTLLFLVEDGVGHGLEQVMVTGSILPLLSLVEVLSILHGRDGESVLLISVICISYSSKG